MRIKNMKELLKNEEKLVKLLDVIDVDWIEENPIETRELIEALVKELRHYKDVVQLQREELMLLKSMVSSNEKVAE